MAAALPPADADACARFLAPSPIPFRSTAGFTIRVIDEEIHSHIGGDSPEAYRFKQDSLIAMIRGCELQIFNDPHVRYPERVHLSGVTGTMSNILTGTFYYLYHYLITHFPAIQVNVVDDLLTLFHAWIMTDERRVPDQDLYVIQDILRILFMKAAEQGLVFELNDSEWWARVIPRMTDKIEELNKKHNSPFWRIIEAIFPGEKEITLFNYGPYENTVNYVNNDRSVYDMRVSSMDDIAVYVERIQNFGRLTFSIIGDGGADGINNYNNYEGEGGSRTKKMTHRKRKNRRVSKNGQRQTIRRRAQRN